jgi:regulator of protease activity HflC (stomatin/prohibitin superfamily)
MLRIDEHRNAQVNDKRGNPIEIAAVVVWRVDDTARASFDVDSCENYVKLQTEAAVRHLASMALRELSEKQVVALDDERKAAMVSNLMTVLCAESEVQSVINTGTLYN